MANKYRPSPLTGRIWGAGLCALAMSVAMADPKPATEPESDRTAELIAFAGLAPGGRVADFLPVTPDFAKIFCNVVGEAGHVYVIFAPSETPADSAPYTRCANVTPEVLRARNFPAPELHSDSDDPGWVYEYWSLRLPVESFVASEPLDMIWISGSYHALHNPDFGTPNIRFVATAWLTALKPGGTLLIVDHVAKEHSGVRDTSKLHRIEPEQVIKEMIAAGFEFVARSDLLHREDDPHTVDAYRLQGRTDRFLLKFRRP